MGSRGGRRMSFATSRPAAVTEVLFIPLPSLLKVSCGQKPLAPRRSGRGLEGTVVPAHGGHGEPCWRPLTRSPPDPLPGSCRHSGRDSPARPPQAPSRPWQRLHVGPALTPNALPSDLCGASLRVGAARGPGPCQCACAMHSCA